MGDKFTGSWSKAELEVARPRAGVLRKFNSLFEYGCLCRGFSCTRGAAIGVPHRDHVPTNQSIGRFRVSVVLVVPGPRTTDRRHHIARMPMYTDCYALAWLDR